MVRCSYRHRHYFENTKSLAGNDRAFDIFTSEDMENILPYYYIIKNYIMWSQHCNHMSYRSKLNTCALDDVDYYEKLLAVECAYLRGNGLSSIEIMLANDMLT